MKLSRRVAHEQIAASAATLSADLLLREQLCFSLIADQFKINLPIWDEHTMLEIRKSQALRLAWASQQRAALENSIPHVRDLAEYAAAAALRAVRQELWLCQQALPATRAGAIDRVPQTPDPALAERAVQTWIAVVDPLQGKFWKAMRHAISVSADVDERAARLFNQARPRGAWWAALPVAQEAARRVSIGTANKIRIAAMGAFNG